MSLASRRTTTSLALRRRLRRATVVGGLLALLLGPVLACSPDGDEVCRDFSTDLEEVARAIVDEAGAASFDDLTTEEADELRTELGQEVYAVEVHRDQLGCDRDRLEDQVCPQLAAITTEGAVAADLLVTLEAAYDCED